MLSFTCQLLFKYTFLCFFTFVQSSFKLASVDSSGLSGNRSSSLSVTCNTIPSMVLMGSSVISWFSASFMVKGLDLNVEDSVSSQGLRVFFVGFSVSSNVVGIFCFFNLGSSKVSSLSKGIFFVLSSFHDFS